MTEIRKEEPRDQDSVHRVNMAAFENVPEAALVDELRVSCEDYLAFVAVEDGIVVGHVLFTPVIVDGRGVAGMGLAPMVVLPSYQRSPYSPTGLPMVASSS